MSESFVNPIFGGHDEPATAWSSRTPERSGAPGTPRSTRSSHRSAALDDLPVAEHVAVFEQAHESLRRTLAGAGEDAPAADRG